MSDILSEQWLSERKDQEWEGEVSQERLDAARVWALPVMVRILAAQELGANAVSDPDFRALVDSLWNGLRDRLTRQDLLFAFMDPMRPLARDMAETLLTDLDRDVEAMSRGKPLQDPQ